MNRVTLVGNLTKDPELRKTNAGMSVVHICVATDDAYRTDTEGNRNTCFLNCSAFGNRADLIAKHLRKGSTVYVEGRLHQRKYTRKDGTTGIEITVLIDAIKFLSKKSQANTDEVNTELEGDEPMMVPPAGYGIDLPDDDLPF